MTPAAPGQFGIFGGIERARVDRRTLAQPKPNGYAAPPGTGPAGETCKTCANCRMRHFKRTFYKCALMVSTWTNDRASDVLLRSPACEKWKQGTPHETTIRTRGGE